MKEMSKLGGGLMKMGSKIEVCVWLMSWDLRKLIVNEYK